MVFVLTIWRTPKTLSRSPFIPFNVTLSPPAIITISISVHLIPPSQTPSEPPDLTGHTPPLHPHEMMQTRITPHLTETTLRQRINLNQRSPFTIPEITMKTHRFFSIRRFLLNSMPILAWAQSPRFGVRFSTDKTTEFRIDTHHVHQLNIYSKTNITKKTHARPKYNAVLGLIVTPSHEM